MASKQIRIRVAGVLSERGKLLLVCHEREGQRYWLLPGGGVEFGETFEAALRREFHEETSLDVRVDRLLCVNETLAPDGSRHGLHFTFLVRKRKGKLRVNRDKRLCDASFISWDSVEKMSLRPPLAKFLAAAQKRRFMIPAQFLGNLWI